jgi:hypothetical protein
MTPRLHHDLLSVLVLLRSGRPDAAREAIEKMLREDDAASQMNPLMQGSTEPTPPRKPVWMRRGP